MSIAQSIPGRLEILEDYLAPYERDGKKPFSGVTALLIQHQLGSQVRMADALIRLGLSPQRLYWVNIPYTTNAIVQKALRALGIPASNFVPCTYHLGKAYAPYQRQRLQEVFYQFKKKFSKRDHLLVLDDGSYFLDAISCYNPPAFRISIVEQTTRGLIKIQSDATLQDYSNRMPVVNVAESKPKKKIESPFIGEAVCANLLRLLKGNLRLGPKDYCLVLGYGDIGRAVIASLIRQLSLTRDRIYVGESNSIKKKLAVRDGHLIWERDPKKGIHFKLVVGCTGRTSLGIGDRIFLEDGACLASASSGASELSREEFIDLADGFPHDQIYVKHRKKLESGSIHRDIRICLVDREVRFLNGGFPVNFTGQVNCVSPKYIQVTHTLQVGAAVQAVSTNMSGVIPLNPELCRFVTRKFRKFKKMGSGLYI